MSLANSLGWHLLDSGALYRLVAVAAMKRNIPSLDEDSLARLARQLDVRFETDTDGLVIALDGNLISSKMRGEEVGAFASAMAAIADVRQALKERQRAFRRPPGLVADGRDMGTVIFPDAALKIFLTASAMERAQRRYKQLKEKGESVNLSRLFRDIEKRDERDRSRTVAPLRPATDAHVINSTGMTVDEVLGKIGHLLNKSSINV